MRASEATAHVQEALAPHVEAGHLPGYAAGVSVAGKSSVCAGRLPLRTAMLDGDLMPGPFPPPVSHDEFMARLGALPLAVQPGEGWIYHTCADVLAVLLFRATDRTCGQLLRERIIDPLGMIDTWFFSREIDRFATAYMPTEAGLELLDPPDGVFSREPRFEALGSGLVSTVPDYLSFQAMLASGGGQVLDAELVALLGSDRLVGPERESARSFLGPGRSWGLMVEVRLEPNDSGLRPGSFGWMGGTGTTAYVDPSLELAGALFTQRGMTSSRDTDLYDDFWRAVYRAVS